MIGYIVGGVVAGVSAAAASGACNRMLSGVVRGAGRLVEGDPLGALVEVKDGVVEPLNVAAAQTVGLFMNTADVAVYAGLRVASLVSDGAKEVSNRAAGFDAISLKLAMGLIMPDTSAPRDTPRVAASA